MSLKQTGAGLFTIPTNPSLGTAAAQSASANTYGSFVTLQASGALGALYLTGIAAALTANSSLHTGTYVDVQVATGASGSETVVGAVHIPLPAPAAATGLKLGGFSGFAELPIAVAANTRIACKTASDSASASLSWLVSLQAILQASVAVDTNFNENVNVININGTAQTARDLGASVLLSSGTGTGQITLNSGAVTVGTNNDKTGYSLSQSFPANFATLSIDSSGRVDVIKVNGTSQTARDLGASVLLSSGTGTGQISLASGAVTVGTNNDKTGYSLTQTFPTNFSATLISTLGHISNVDTLTTYTGNTVQTGDSFGRLGVAGVGLTNLGDARLADLDATISSRSTYNGSDTSGTSTLLTRLSSDRAVSLDSISGIKTKTDSLTFSVASQADVNIKSVNSVTVNGVGSSGNPWGP